MNDEGRELSLLLENGAIVRDPGWRSIGDVMASFHGFSVHRVYGTIVDAETLEPINHCK